MAKKETATPAVETVTWIPTAADSTVLDLDGNVISVNGVPVPKAFDRDQPANAGEALGTK